jgi:two-component system, chemotaxis family, chemotaxis protein CheV
MAAQTGILLEAGTNEMELLVFRLDKWYFGINVAKVREIIMRQKTIRIPHAPAIVEGSFKLREEVLTLVNIGQYFSMQGEETTRGEGLIIIVEFNQFRCGVLVDAVEVIHRFRWDDIIPPPPYLSSLNAPITAVAKVDQRLVLIADFESVIGETLGNPNPGDGHLVDLTPISPENIRLLVADDSGVIRHAIRKILEAAGFKSITIVNDGLEAWETLEAGRGTDGKPFDLLITDIEMPRMDGLHLTSKVKQDPQFESIPVILFSSLISPDNQKKGQAVGANAQVTKLDAPTLLQAIEDCMRVKISQ